VLDHSLFSVNFWSHRKSKVLISNEDLLNPVNNLGNYMSSPRMSYINGAIFQSLVKSLC
jgi:hypothetical protein